MSVYWRSLAKLSALSLLRRSRIELRSEQATEGGPVLINLHEDERTSVEAAREVLRRRPGRLLTLHCVGQRAVVFWQSGRPLAFDPNRIFSEAGIDATLRSYGSASQAARRKANAVAESITAALTRPPAHAVIALHNNWGSDGYSMRSYQAGGAFAGDAARLSVGASEAPSDFLLVTTDALFERLVPFGFNTVLQSPGALDDGSLSHWCQRQGIPYINIETRRGRHAKQRSMIEAAMTAAPPR